METSLQGGIGKLILFFPKGKSLSAKWVEYRSHFSGAERMVIGYKWKSLGWEKGCWKGHFYIIRKANIFTYLAVLLLICWTVLYEKDFLNK